MSNLKRIFPMLLVLGFLLTMAGCGGSSGGNTAANDQFATNTSGSGSGSGTGTGSTPITAQDPTFNISLFTDLTKPSDLTALPQIDANNGTVLLTAKFVSVEGGVLIDGNYQYSDYINNNNNIISPASPMPSQKIYYKVIAGPGSITYPQYPNSTSIDFSITDSSGNANAIYTAGNVQSTTNVIIEASTTVGGNSYRAYTTFQIVRGTGVIMFTDFAGQAPLTQSNMLDDFEAIVDSAATPSVDVLQLIPFKLTDSNGNPRVWIPVTLYVYSISTLDPSDVTVNFLVPPTVDGIATGSITEPNKQTITTDSAGMGIFNVKTNILSPAVGSFTAATVAFRAVTNDAIPVTAYVGRSYSLKTPTTP